MSDEAFTINIKKLDSLLKALQKKPPLAKIGILGDGGGARTPTHGQKKAPTNALIGAVHEYGSPARNIPQRSFLRVPLNDYLGTYLQQSGAFKKSVLEEVIRQGSVIPWLTQVAIEAKRVVLDAFGTQGFGKWPAWKDPHYTNQGGSLLVDSQQLRNSIDYSVEGDK